MNFPFDVEIAEEITAHVGYSDFSGKVIKMPEEGDKTIKLRSGKEIIEIKISDIYAVTKAEKKK